MGQRILVVGNSVVDVIGLAPEALPGFGELVSGRGPARMCVGGNGAIAAAAAATLGADAELASAVGDDAWGRWLTDRLMTLGVGVRQLQTRSDGPTSTTISLVRPDGERALVTHNGVADSHDPRLVSVEGLPQGSWLLVGALLLVPAYSGEALRDLAARARDAGLRVALDLSWDPSGTWELAKIPVDLADVFLGNADELRNATGTQDGGAAIEAVLAAGAHAVVAKMGPEGAVVATCEGGPVVRVAAPRVRALNATGTGDVFNGALVVALSRGTPLAEAVRFACGAGAVRVAGGCDTFPTTSEVEAILSRADVT